jgi:flagellar motor switch protein FliG
MRKTKDMERLEKVDNDEVKSSRDKIIETIQRLAAQGSIVLKLTNLEEKII